jgi:hypothetical protein
VGVDLHLDLSDTVEVDSDSHGDDTVDVSG